MRLHAFSWASLAHSIYDSYVKAYTYSLGIIATSLLCSCAPPEIDTFDSPGGKTTGSQSSGSGTTGTTIVNPDGTVSYITPQFNLDGEPIYSRAVPLTNAQWAQAVKNALRLDSEPTQANSFLAPVGGFTTFINNERVLEVTNQMREAYQYAAAEIAEDLMAEEGAVTQINAGATADSFIRTVGRRMFRRPLTEAEVTTYKGLYDVGVTVSGDQSDFVKGASLVVEGFLQSPNFLYRTELEPVGQPLTPYEVAAKLSFWLLGASPSDALLDRVAQSALDTPEGIADVVDEMLEEPAASKIVVDLYAELLAFARYLDVIKDDPAFDPSINAELETVARLFFQRLFEENLGLDEMLTSTQGYVGPKLAGLYGISPAPSTPTLMDLGETRLGFFSQVPYLMQQGDGSNSDAIHRGISINYEVLCAKLPAPTFQVTPPPPPKPNQSSRQRIEAHTGFGTCGESCHGGYINPMGYAFENFDGLGRERDIDNGQPIDTTSAYPFADDVMTPFSGAPELMNIMAQGETAHACFVKNIMSYGLQRDIVKEDQALIDQLAAVSMSDAGSIKEIIRQIAKSAEFRARAGAPQ